VKKSMEDYYKKLTLEAEEREERAKWKAKRLALKMQRMQFWKREGEKVTKFEGKMVEKRVEAKKVRPQSLKMEEKEGYVVKVERKKEEEVYESLASALTLGEPGE